MQVIIGMATFKGREKHVEKAIASLSGQGAEIRLYDNSKETKDLTDNGKFEALLHLSDPVYYLSCDDDLIYPATYVRGMIEAIDKHQCIVTHHGRLLLDFGRSYYRGHQAFRCLDANKYNCEIDVAGTGVTGFRTDYFNPVEIAHHPDQKMSDLVFSHLAASQGKKIVILPHTRGYIQQIPIQAHKSIHGTESRNEGRQMAYADEILRTKLKRNASDSI